MTTLRRQTGQATVTTLLFLVVLLGMAALVLDLGSWYRADRATQSTADSAALAAAQALPDDQGQATALAQQYASKNGGGVQSISFPDANTVTVVIGRSAPGIFTKLFGLASVNVGAKATAHIDGIAQALYAAPIVVNRLHPMLNNCNGPCFGSNYKTTLPLDKTGAPGAFDLVNLQNDPNGTIGTSELSRWILHGFDSYLPLGQYFSDTGAKWNSSDIQGALQQVIQSGRELLFPVYDKLVGQGSNAEYHIVAWVGFHVTAVDANGSSGSVSGWFTQVLWQGIQVGSGGSSGAPYSTLGAQTISLVK